jgi:hypothetical protein
MLSTFHRESFGSKVQTEAGKKRVRFLKRVGIILFNTNSISVLGTMKLRPKIYLDHR